MQIISPSSTADVKADVNTGILNTNIIGHITSQPPYLAKQIKQEIIDTATQNVMEKHTQDCALNKFIQEWQSNTGLCIEDVRTLITADTTSWAIKTEPPYSLSSNNESSVCVVTDPTPETQQKPLLVVTAAAKEALINPDPITEPLLVVMTGLPLDQPGLTEYTYDSTTTRWSHLLNRPVPVSPKETSVSCNVEPINQPVFPEPEIEIPDVQSAPNTAIITTTHGNSPANYQCTMATTSTMAVDTTIHGNNPPNKQARDTTCGNPPDTVSTDTTCGNTPDMSSTNTTRSNNPETIKAPEPLHLLPASNTASEQPLETPTSKYYEVLTPNKDDIISLCHNYIMANKCSVNLEKLNNNDIEKINAMLCNKPEDSSSGIQSGEEKPVKKVSLCPCK